MTNGQNPPHHSRQISDTGQQRGHRKQTGRSYRRRAVYDRSVLSYFIKPLSDQVARAFRER
jgi:hypothetical protein